MWLTYFTAFAVIVALIRIVIFAISGGSFEDKMSKAKNWIIGLVLLSISWFVLGKIFGVNTSMRINNTHEIESDTNNDDDNSNNGVPINLN
jgi:branched-subunit amino acid permease